MRSHIAVVVACSLLVCAVLVYSVPSSRHAHSRHKRNVQEEILSRLRRGLRHSSLNGNIADSSQAYSHMCQIQTNVKNSQTVFGSSHVYFPVTFIEKKCSGSSSNSLVPSHCPYDPNLDCVTQYQEKSFMKRPKRVASCSTNWRKECPGTVKFTKKIAVGCECMIPL